MVSPLLVTKLHFPSVRSPLVQRKRLLEKLDRGLTSKLILISAAAGFGKTTLLSEWAHHIEFPVSWLSLDELDNDPLRFWTYVVAALQQTDRNIGSATLSMLRSLEPFGVEACLTPLINELAQLQTDLILALDDYHLITNSTIHAALTFLLEHLSNRVHHILQRTQPNGALEDRVRAAQCYERQGRITDAIQHAIAAKSFEYAAALIEQEIQTNENPRFDAIGLRHALAQLPNDLTHSHPWLLVAKAWVGFTSSQFADAVLAIQTLEQLLNASDPTTENADRLWGLVIALKGMQARGQGNTTESVAFMEKALQLLPQDNSWLRSPILLNLGVTYFVADNYEKAKRLLPEVSRIGQARNTAEGAIAGLYLQAQFLALRSRIDEATSLCQQGLDLATGRGWLATYAGVLVQVALADLLREQNQLEAAAQHLTQSIDRAIQNQQPGLMMGYITLARVRQAQADFQAAWTAIHAAERCQPWLWSTILSVEACQVRLYLAEGNLDEAIAWAENSGLSVDGELHYSPT